MNGVFLDMQYFCGKSFIVETDGRFGKPSIIVAIL